MATIVNDRDVFLQAEAIRLTPTSGNYILLNTSSSIFKDVGGTISPTNIVISAVPMGILDGTVTFSTVPSTTLSISGNIATLPSANMLSDSVVVTATLNYLGSNYSSSVTISKIESGTPLTADLTNESHVVSAEFDGTGYSLTAAGGTFKVYLGASDVTLGSTFSGTTTKNGLTFTINSATGIYTLSGSSWTTDSEFFDVTATYNSFSITKRYSIAKAKIGISGAYAYISTDSAVLYKNSVDASTSGTYIPSSITIRGKLQVANQPVTAYGYVTYTPNGGAESSKTASSTGLVYTPAATGVSSVTLKLYALIGDTVPIDTETIPVIFKGATGDPGDPGAPGAPGSPGDTGPRSATGYLYYSLNSSSAPSTPTAPANSYSFTTHTFTGLTANWSTTFTAGTLTEGTKFWACRYTVTESSFGGTQSISFTSPFNWTNFTGLVTFTNHASSFNTDITSISGSKINTGNITVSNGALGYICSTGKTTYANDSTAGFFLGFDGTTPKFNIGNSTKYLKWTGSNIVVSGDINTSGYVYASGGNTPPGFSFTSAVSGCGPTTSQVGVFGSGSLYGMYITNNGTNSNMVGLGIDTGASAIVANSVNGSGIVASVNQLGSGSSLKGTRAAGGSGHALYVDGTMYISSNAKVANLNADRLDDYHASDFVLATNASNHYHSLGGIIAGAGLVKFKYYDGYGNFAGNIYLSRIDW